MSRDAAAEEVKDSEAPSARLELESVVVVADLGHYAENDVTRKVCQWSWTWQWGWVAIPKLTPSRKQLSWHLLTRHGGDLLLRVVGE